MAPHCPEHENRGDRLTAAEACIKNLKYNWNMGREHMATQVKVLNEEVKSKLSASIFYKVMTLLVAVMFAVLGVQWNILSNIDTKVDSIATKQAVVVSTLENMGK